MLKNPYLRTALKAIEASRPVIDSYLARKKIPFTLKPDRSVVTPADRQIEKIIIKHIKDEWPDHGLYGEELGQKTGRSDLTWIIDPIDGTRAFTRGLPEFSTLIALKQGDDIVMGVSYVYQFNQLMYAFKGEGAYLNHQPVRVSPVSELSQTFFSYVSAKYFFRAGLSQQFQDLVNTVALSRSLGNTLGNNLLAQGKVDCQVDFYGKLYDYAALKVIVEEAGGLVTDLAGNPWQLDSDSFVASNGLIHSQLLKKLAK